MAPLQLSELSYEDLQSAIKAYQAFDYKTVSIDEASKLFRLIIKHFITQTLVWKEPLLYRARKHTFEGSFTNVGELIYPKNPASYGRLNDVGESLFYGASSRDTAFLEMRPRLGDIITMLDSRLINGEVAPKFMEVGIRQLMAQQNHSPEFIKQNLVVIDNALGTEDNRRRYKLINDFLIKEITKRVEDNQSHDYKGTIAIGQFYMKRNDLADGMIYPSMSRTGAECIAIKPQSYHRFYEPVHCSKWKIADVDTSGAPTFYCLAASTQIDSMGNITWDE